MFEIIGMIVVGLVVLAIAIAVLILAVKIALVLLPIAIVVAIICFFFFRCDGNDGGKVYKGAEQIQRVEYIEQHFLVLQNRLIKKDSIKG